MHQPAMLFLSVHVVRTLLALAVVLCACPGSAGAQALRPLSTEFLGVLGETDAALAQASGILKRIKGEDISFSAPPRAHVSEAIGRIEKNLAQVQGLSNELRRRESLLVLLALNRSLGGVQNDLQGFSSMLQSATVRSAAALDTLNGLLAALDKSAARLNAALLQFDRSSTNLLERLDGVAPALHK